MPWWGWVIIGLVVIVVLPIKIKILKKMTQNQRESSISNQDME